MVAGTFCYIITVDVWVLIAVMLNIGAFLSLLGGSDHSLDTLLPLNPGAPE